MLEAGNKLLVAHRRMFESEQPRYFVGEVVAYDSGIVKLAGYSFARDNMSEGGLYSQRRCANQNCGDRFWHVSSCTSCQIKLTFNKFVLSPTEGDLRLTDGNLLNMNLTESGSFRSNLDAQQISLAKWELHQSPCRLPQPRRQSQHPLNSLKFIQPVANYFCRAKPDPRRRSRTDRKAPVGWPPSFGTWPMFDRRIGHRHNCLRSERAHQGRAVPRKSLIARQDLDCHRGQSSGCQSEGRPPKNGQRSDID